MIINGSSIHNQALRKYKGFHIKNQEEKRRKIYGPKMRKKLVTHVG